MNEILERITRKKEQLDSFRPLPPALEKNLYTWARNELTYTSNAIEGNTLTSSQTAMVIEKGLTIGARRLFSIARQLGMPRLSILSKRFLYPLFHPCGASFDELRRSGFFLSIVYKNNI